MPTKTGDMTKRELAKKNSDELCKLSNEIFMLKRQLKIAMTQWDNWKTEAMRLNEKLQKYEPGSPMILNKTDA